MLLMTVLAKENIISLNEIAIIDFPVVMLKLFLFDISHFRLVSMFYNNHPFHMKLLLVLHNINNMLPKCLA